MSTTKGGLPDCTADHINIRASPDGLYVPMLLHALLGSRFRLPSCHAVLQVLGSHTHVTAQSVD